MEYLKDETLLGDRMKARKLCIKAKQYELLEGVIYRRSFLKPWLRCVGSLQADYLIQEIHKGSCSMHVGPRFMVAKAMRLGYYWPTMHRDARDMIHTCNACQVHHPMPRNPQQLLTPIRLHGHSTKTKAVAIITGSQVKKLVWDNIVCRFDLPGEIVSDNEIRMPTCHTAVVDAVHNNEDLRLNLNLLEKRRECAAIREAKAKLKMTKYYNTRVRDVTFRPGDYVFRSNEASHAMDGGKLGLKWEGPYKVTEALGDEAYKLRFMEGTVLPRT
nr:reverse transcriptase domain-containing protein [Tanacetum cinerariifolium]